MLFSSITFLYYFLPCVLFLYFLVPRNWKNSVLLIASLFFYAWGEPYYVLYMLGSIGVGYVAGLLIEKWKVEPAASRFGISKAKWVLILSVGVHIVVLFFFKISPSLPIGISFYTFQVVSYIIDVYRGDVKAQRKLLYFATYVSMFPQLIAGPIVRYIDIEKQLEHREHSFEKAALGIRRFVLGLAKKVLLANTLGELCEIFALSGDKSVLYYWMYAVAFTLHIYFDFSGYSDMAIGLGKIMGFDYLENFNYPYISRSITEFWRRWHMSLGSWFRDYVYIPLGGNRVPKGRYLLNIFLVWALTGLWHGGAWNFVIWGLFYAVLLMIEKMWLLKHLQKEDVGSVGTLGHLIGNALRKTISHIYVLIAVMVGFVIFNAQDMSEAFGYLWAMFGIETWLGFGAGKLPLVSAEAVYYLKSYGVIFILAIVGATPMAKNAWAWLESKIRGAESPAANGDGEKSSGTKVPTGFVGRCLVIVEFIALLALLVAATAFLVDGSFNPFLYFRF